MTRYREITEARKVLELPESSTMAEIKSRYRALIARWDPDRCREDKDRCNEMTRRVIAAYKTIVAYCSQYKYSFSEEEVRKYLSPEEWLLERFGKDPLWGRGAERE